MQAVKSLFGYVVTSTPSTVTYPQHMVTSASSGSV